MKNKKQINNIIWDFVDKHHNFIFFILISVLAIVARGYLLKYNSGDYDLFLGPWSTQLKEYGGLGGLAYNIGNYTPIYMTILAILTYLPVSSLFSIKVVSIIFDFIGAIAAKKIVERLLPDNKNVDKISLLVYGLYLFLPTVLLNGAYWAQCDGIYTAFVLISILYLMKKNYKLSILFWSIALAFKFQAIFIFPLYVLMYIAERKIKFKYILIVPLTIFVFSLPKVLYTGDLLVGFRVYVNQAGTYSQYITLNFPNIYGIFFGGGNSNLIDMPFDNLNTIGMIVTFVILIALAYLVYMKKEI